jgi:hypothetical protein
MYASFQEKRTSERNDGTDSLGTTRDLITYTALLVVPLLICVVSFWWRCVPDLWRLFVSLVVSVPHWIALAAAITTVIAIVITTVIAAATTALDHSRNSTRNRTATIA